MWPHGQPVFEGLGADLPAASIVTNCSQFLALKRPHDAGAPAFRSGRSLLRGHVSGHVTDSDRLPKKSQRFWGPAPRPKTSFESKKGSGKGSSEGERSWPMADREKEGSRPAAALWSMCDCSDPGSPGEGHCLLALGLTGGREKKWLTRTRAQDDRAEPPAGHCWGIGATSASDFGCVKGQLKVSCAGAHRPDLSGKSRDTCLWI